MTTALSAELDKAKVDAFTERLLGILSGGALSLMISIGHRTGLFDALAELPPSTSGQIAKRAGLNERYVREWLGAMVTGGIVEYDPTDLTYSLPAEYASLITRSAVPLNVASTMQFVSVLGGVEDELVECFQNGGGVPYEKFHRFHEVMAEESAQTVVAALAEHILPLADGLCEQLERGIEVLDIGCGSGRAVCAMAAEFPNSRFAGYDLCEDAIAAARAEAKRQRLKNVCFDSHDVTNLGLRNKFDLVTAFDAIHDQAQPQKVLQEIVAALKPGGTFLMQDILASSHLEKNLDNPLASFLYSISTMHCMTVSLAQGGVGLGTCWGRELAETMLRDAGFVGITVEKLPHDDMNYYYIAKKPE
ncbi:MAG: class I SAM-dependent methyltransferase [Pirellulales bacterium]